MLFETGFTTSAENLVNLVAAVAEPKAVVLEESTLAAWAWRVIRPHATRVVAADPVHNAWIGRDERGDDVSAARKLAELLRGGFVHPVHHTCQSRQVFKELVMAYEQAVREITRFKSRLKAKFRQHGVHCTDASLYHPTQRAAWLDRLDHPGARLQAELLLETIDQLLEHKARLRAEIARRARDHEPIARFRELPGIGLIRAATFFAIIDVPQRFANTRKLWAYCGLAVVSRSSGGTQGPEHLNRRCNRRLKAVAKSAAVNAINLGDNRFARQYQSLLAKQISPDNARLTVARAIISALWAIWLNGQHYRPTDPEE